MTGVKRRRAPEIFHLALALCLPPHSKGIPSFLFDLGIPRSQCERERERDQCSPSNYLKYVIHAAVRVEYLKEESLHLGDVFSVSSRPVNGFSLVVLVCSSEATPPSVQEV